VDINFFHGVILGEAHKTYCYTIHNEDCTHLAIWRRLATAINSTHTISHLVLSYDDLDDDYEFNAPLIVRNQCVESFYEELKNNKSIVHLEMSHFNFDVVLSSSMLGYFLQNNTSIEKLTLVSRTPVTLERSNVLSSGLVNAKLKEIEMRHCRFENNGAFEQIVSACTGVETLWVMCRQDYQCTALAALLRNQTAILQCLHVPFPHYEPHPHSGNSGIDKRLALGNISSSLVGNTKLRYLYFRINDGLATHEFDNILCDSSSLLSIHNSNHTLELNSSTQLTRFTEECLKLNKNANKSKVVQIKIIQYYFLGDFDMTPFASMPLSVLPEVMSLSVGEGMRNKQTSIFELLRHLPDLCNVSSRVDNPEHDTASVCNKRQKLLN
jgi:hypothetical protein